MAAGVNAEVAWNCGFAALTVPVEIEDPVHLQGLGHLSWTELHSFLSFFLSFIFFSDMDFASRNGGLMGFSGNQSTADKSGSHRLQILPWRR